MTHPFLLTRRRTLGSLAAAAAATPWLAARAATPPGPGARSAEVALPSLGLRQRTLANGLQVIALPDRGTATASVQVWYRVGGKDDPPGRSGFAHLFEHMMFKRTRYMAAEMFDRLTEDVGGINNAFTAEDVTAYQSEVPANHLERLLWAEAERMQHLEVDQPSFDSERAVVQEELRQRVLASPYGRLFHALPGLAFEQHPYRRPVVGSIEDLNAATLDDVKAFHRTYYRPDNAVLIVAGHFDDAALDAAVDRYFGHIPRPAEAIPRVAVQEPARARDVRSTLAAPRVPLSAVALVWKGPAARHEDAAALDVASALLSGGESSRMNQALVYRDRVAQAAGFQTQLNADAGMLVAYAIGVGGKPAAQQLPALEAALMREITALSRGSIAQAEFDKVRTQLLTAALAERQTPNGRATAAGWAVIQYGDARQADQVLQRLQAVRAADVQRVLRRHLLQARSATLHYVQAEAPAAAPPDAAASQKGRP
ncbi:M16 family metallopeptidase [Aquincola tertiaricarbonis]|uniref:M16 family metallopeptidase n=1 Tax=Aquincola tertiaricarbonis TaxID=391953 RepID=UPI0009FAAD6E|nr:pitrilysin family protein [Aquincola tertiaricarbonis]